MDAYKKILKSRKLRFKILNFLEFVTDSAMLKIQYKIKTGKQLSLENPKKYSEKIQWYKLNYKNPNLVKCVDKFDVRVDLYYVNGNVIFGQLTFFPWSGYIRFNPESFDYAIGDKFDLNRVKS